MWPHPYFALYSHSLHCSRTGGAHFCHLSTFLVRDDAFYALVMQEHNTKTFLLYSAIPPPKGPLLKTIDIEGPLQNDNFDGFFSLE